jgi:hypothetical protein
MSKMGFHDPFGWLKHKLWPKEGPKVKLTIWLPSTKVGNPPDFLAFRWQVTYCWKALNKGYNFSLNLTSIEGLHTKLWASKVAGVLILGISGISRLSHWSLGIKWHLSDGPMARHIVYYKGGRWWLPPSLGHDDSCESMFVHGSSVHQRCSDYTLTNLLFGLCRSMWINDLLVNHSSPHLEATTGPSTLEVLWAKERAQLLLLLMSSSLDLQLSHQGTWGCVNDQVVED